MSDELPMLRKESRRVVRKQPELPTTPPEKKEDELSFAQIEAPMSGTAIGYIRKRYDVKLSGQQATAVRRLTLGLGEAGAKLQDGKFVESGTDAIKWLLENLK